MVANVIALAVIISFVCLLIMIGCCKELYCSARDELEDSSNGNSARGESVESSNGSSLQRVNTSSILRDCRKIKYKFHSLKKSRIFSYKSYSKNSVCSICMEDFTEGEELVLCPCKHCYHERCIKEWLKLKNSCPLCKLNICSGPHATESTPLLHIV